MERAIIILSAVCGVIGKHVYVREEKTWEEAQTHCRQHFTDLSPISSYRDEDDLRKAATVAAADMYVHVLQFESGSWIGLYREPQNLTGWRWSGGGYATYQNWENGYPKNGYYGELNFNVFNTNPYMLNSNPNLGFVKWHNHRNDKPNPFFCLKWTVVKQNKTWQQAMWYCKKHHTDLVSLSSETEVLLAQREIQEAETTDHVWTGLRYFGDRWLWVNGDPLRYEAWRRGDQDHQCPAWSHRCGALDKTGRWWNYSCQEKLNFICY